MKTIIACLVLIAAISCPLSGAQKSAPMELVIGTYRQGNNITEPRPVQSEYFQTKLGAFQIIQGFAGYKLFIDVIKHPAKRIYTRSIIENPENPKKPFVYEHFIDPDTPSTTVTHGPVKGLKIYQDYTIEFVAYADEQRTKEIDRLTQKIRCYVDTTGPQLKMLGGMKTKTSDSLQEHAAPASAEAPN